MSQLIIKFVAICNDVLTAFCNNTLWQFITNFSKQFFVNVVYLLNASRQRITNIFYEQKQYVRDYNVQRLPKYSQSQCCLIYFLMFLAFN